MFKNFVKTSFRFLSRNKSYSFINIFGLALGTLCCVYIILYVTDQYSYDKQQPDAKDIYRVVADLSLPGEPAGAPAGWATADRLASRARSSSAVGR